MAKALAFFFVHFCPLFVLKITFNWPFYVIEKASILSENVSEGGDEGMAAYPQYNIQPQQIYQQQAYQPQGYQQPIYQQTVQTYQPQQAQGLNGRMVTSREEALAVPVDFMGGLMVMPDMAHKRIFTKNFNPQTGSADFVEYRAVEPENAQDNQTEIDKLRAAVDEMQKEIEELKTGMRRRTNRTAVDENV